MLSHLHFWCAPGFDWRQSSVRLDDMNAVIWTRVHTRERYPCQLKKSGLGYGSCELRFTADVNAIDLSVSPAPLSYCCSLGQTNGIARCLTMTAEVWKPCSTMFLHNSGHWRPPNVNEIFHGGIYKIFNSKRGFTDHNACRRSHDRGWQHAGSTLHVSQGTIKLTYI